MERLPTPYGICCIVQNLLREFVFTPILCKGTSRPSVIPVSYQRAGTACRAETGGVLRGRPTHRHPARPRCNNKLTHPRPAKSRANEVEPLPTPPSTRRNIDWHVARASDTHVGGGGGQGVTLMDIAEGSDYRRRARNSLLRAVWSSFRPIENTTTGACKHGCCYTLGFPGLRSEHRRRRTPPPLPPDKDHCTRTEYTPIRFSGYVYVLRWCTARQTRR